MQFPSCHVLFVLEKQAFEGDRPEGVELRWQQHGPGRRPQFGGAFEAAGDFQ